MIIVPLQIVKELHQSIEFKWLMSFIKDESFGRTRVRFTGETIFGQTIHTSPNSKLSGPFLGNQRVNVKKTKWNFILVDKWKLCYHVNRH